MTRAPAPPNEEQRLKSEFVATVSHELRTDQRHPRSGEDRIGRLEPALNVLNGLSVAQTAIAGISGLRRHARFGSSSLRLLIFGSAPTKDRIVQVLTNPISNAIKFS
jgi:signal transduction histidine kinase